MARKTKTSSQNSDENRAPEAVLWSKWRWWHTLIFQLFWPTMFLGTLYTLVFFFINSSDFSAVMTSQMNGRFYGNFAFERVTLSPLLDNIKIEGILLADPKGKQVIKIEEVALQLPLWEMGRQLVSNNRLELRGVEARGVEVSLDFSRSGSFNLTQVFFTNTPPSPEPPEPSDFAIGIYDVVVTDGLVNIKFGSFTVELEDVDIRHFELGIGGPLRMSTAPVSDTALPSISARRGRLTFNPRMFGAGLGWFGDKEIGLLLEGNGGSGGVVWAAMQRSAAATLNQSLLRLRGEESNALNLLALQLLADTPMGVPMPQMLRGDLVLDVKKISIENFWWLGAEFGMGRLKMGLPGPKDAGETRVEINDFMMDLAPWDTIGYAADLELDIAPQSPLLDFFLGDPLQLASALFLNAHIEGDFNAAHGEFSVQNKELSWDGIEVADLNLKANIHGQTLGIEEVSLRTLGGDVEVHGSMRLLDGDMDIWAKLGSQVPDPEFGHYDGLNISRFLPPDLKALLSGEISALIHLTQSKGTLGVQLASPLVFELENRLPYQGGSRVILGQGSFPTPGMPPHQNSAPPLLTKSFHRIRLNDDLFIDAAPERVEISSGLFFQIDTQEITGFASKIKGKNLGRITPLLTASGPQPMIEGLRTGSFLLDVTLDQKGSALGASVALDLRDVQHPLYNSGSLRLNAEISAPFAEILKQSTRGLKASLEVHGRRINYEAHEISSLDLSVGVSGNKVSLKTLEVDSNYGQITAEGDAELFSGSLTKIRSEIPLNLKLDGDAIALGKIGALIDLPISGEAQVHLEIGGTQLDPVLSAGVLKVEEFRGFGEYVPMAEMALSFEHNHLKLNHLKARYGESLPGNKEARLEVSGDFHLLDNTFELRVDLQPLQISDIPSLQKGALGDLGLKGTLYIDELILRGDLDIFQGGTVERPFYASGALGLNNLSLNTSSTSDAGEITRRLIEAGDISLDINTEDEVLLIEGVLFDDIKLAVRADSWRPLDAEATLSFYQLPVLDLVARFNGEEIEEASDAPKRGLTTSEAFVQGAIVGATLKGSGANPSLLEALSLTGSIYARYSEKDSLKLGLSLERLHVELGGRIIENTVPIEVSFANDLVTIKHFDIGTGDYQIFMEGDVSLGGDVSLEIGGLVDMSLLELAGGVVPEANGSMILDIELDGDIMPLDPETGEEAFSMDEFKFDVELAVNEQDPVEVSVRGLPLDEAIQLDRGRILLNNRSFSIPVLAGRLFGGTFELSGVTGLDNLIPQGASFRLAANDITYRVPGVASFTVDADLNINAGDLLNLSPETFELGGEINIQEANVYWDYDVLGDALVGTFEDLVKDKHRASKVDVSLLRKVPFLETLSVDVTLKSDDNINVKTAVSSFKVDMGFGCNLRVYGDLQENFSRLKALGSVNFAQGSLFFRGREFIVQPGSELQFNNNLLPEISLTMQGEINTQQNFMSSVVGSTVLDQRRRIQTSDLARGSQLYLVTIAVNGDLSEAAGIKPEFESAPFLSNNDIITLILTGQTLDQISASGEDNPAFSVAFETLIAPFVESQVGGVISAEAFKFAIADGAAQLFFIRQFSHRLRLAGGLSLSGAAGNQVAGGGEYKFFDDFSLETTGQNGDTGDSTVNLRLRYHLSLD